MTCGIDSGALIIIAPIVSFAVVQCVRIITNRWDHMS